METFTTSASRLIILNPNCNRHSRTHSRPTDLRLLQQLIKVLQVLGLSLNFACRLGLRGRKFILNGTVYASYEGNMQQWCGSMGSDQVAIFKTKFVDNVLMLQTNTNKSSGCRIIGGLAETSATRHFRLTCFFSPSSHFGDSVRRLLVLWNGEMSLYVPCALKLTSK